MLVAGIGLGVEAAGEDDPRHLVLEQELDVLALGDPAGRERAEHRGIATLGERAADDVGEGGEDRVLELRQHQTNEPAALAPELRRPFIAEHVEGDEHRLPRRLGDPALPFRTRLTVPG